MRLGADVTGYGLAIHTTSAALGLAIANATGDARSQVWELGRDTSNLLHQYLVDFLYPQTWSDVAFLAVATGPGGFTGTRIGVVAARTLAQQLDLPLFGISTLAAVAWQTAKTLDHPTAIAIQMRAQREELFGAIYQQDSLSQEHPQWRTQFPDTVMTGQAWEAVLRQWPTAYHRVEADTAIATSVSDLLELAWHDWQQGVRPHWSQVLPFYGQHPVT